MLALPDGTPVRLRLMKTVTSAEAKVGETVDFEVTEPVISNGLVVIPQRKPGVGGRCTKVEPKKRFGRGGELEVSAESVRLADGSKAQLRASREEGNGGYERGQDRRDHRRVAGAGLGEGQGRRVPERPGETRRT